MNKPFILNNLRGMVPELARLLELDLAEHFNQSVTPVETVISEEERRRIDLIARVFTVIENHPARGFTYPEIAELAGVPRDYVNSRTWPAVLSKVGLCKLGKEVTTKYGISAVYCRKEDAPALSVMSTAEVIKELTPGLYTGRPGKKRDAVINGQPTVGSVGALTF